jgi:hypothetical protein
MIGRKHMPRQKTRLHYKKLVSKIINWLNANIDEGGFDSGEVKDALACDSADLKQKIELYLEGQDEF